MGQRASSQASGAGAATTVQQRPAILPSARPDVAQALRQNWQSLGLGPWPSSEKLPIVYSDDYNISFFKIENLHPFDSKKYRRVVSMLEGSGVLHRSQLVAACEASLTSLSDVHSQTYLENLERSSLKIAQVTELAPLAAMPAALLRLKVLRPMRFMAGGTVQAGALAMERGWAINLGGGMHHAHYHDGGGWCAYDDITLMLHSLRQASGGLFQRAMIIDLDVHQGNGHERSKLHFKDTSTFIVDVYNSQIYPSDSIAKAGIDIDAPVHTGCEDQHYMQVVSNALEEAFKQCNPPPQLIIYNAGTDILAGDPLGLLRVSEQGVVKRDEAVFEAAIKRGVPIVMLLSGGYTQASTPCIARSVTNLVQRFKLVGGAEE